MTEYWTLYLQKKHGNEAAYRCRHHMVESAKSGAALRNEIWSGVYRRLKS